VLVLAAYAEPVAQLTATDYVNDFAHVLDQNTIAQMDEICRQIDQKAHAQIAVVTIKSLDGSDIESYAVDLFHQWGVGSKSSNRGVLILYAINDHRARIEVGYGLEPFCQMARPADFSGKPFRSCGGQLQPGLCCWSLRAWPGVIAQDAGVQLTTPTLAPAPSQRVRQPDGGISAGGIVLLIIIVLVVLFTPLRGILFWMLVSGMFGGGGSRGGFGGGGGGFGGGAGSVDSAVVAPEAAARAAVGSK